MTTGAPPGESGETASGRASECPDENLFDAFVQGTLAPEERAELEAHIGRCAGCHELVVALARAAGPSPLEAPASVPSRTLIGERLGRYSLERKIGSGGMGDVYAALDTRLDRRVAVKVLPPELATDPERRARFEREARAAARLSHRNIVTMHSVEESDGLLFIVMELIEGTPLSAVIASAGRGLPIVRILELAAGIAEAVAEAHEHGVLHRDLKPSNILVTRDGTAKVLDFGLAKVARALKLEGAPSSAADASCTIDGRILGTPAYMSPEQAAGKPVDHRTDVFSLGIILYEMATGKRPFDGDSTLSIISSVLKDTPPGVADVRKEVPRRLAAVVERCLAKDPRKRYQSAHDLAFDLDAAKGDGKGSLSGRSWLTWMAAAPLLVGAGALLGFVGLDRKPPAPALAAPSIRKFVRATTGLGLAVDPQIAPDGTWFVFAAPVEGLYHVFRQRVGGENATDLSTGTKAHDRQPSISPDGQRLAFRSDRDGGGIYVMGATGESIRRVTDTGYHPTWSPEGNRLLISTVSIDNPSDRSQMSEAWEVNVESGERRRIEAGRDAFQGAWSPHGQRIAFCRISGTDNRAQVFTVPVGGGEPKVVLELQVGSTVWTPKWSPDGRYVYYSSSTSGVFNLGRIEVDEATGEPKGGPEEITKGVGTHLSHPSFSAKGDRLLFQSHSVSSNIERVRLSSEGMPVGAPVPVTRGDNSFIFPEVSPDGEHLLFCNAMVRDDDENIYMARADGSGFRALTFDQGKRNRLPRWAPDGKELLFYSNRSGAYSAWSIRADGGGLRPVAEVPGTITVYAVPSRDDARTAIRVGHDVVVFDRRRPFADQNRPLARYPDALGRDFWPFDWSPDGKRLAGMSSPPDSMVVVLTLETQSYERLVPGLQPRWLPDGKRLIYTDPDGVALKLHEPGQSVDREILALRPDTVETPALSRDGKWLYFKRAREEAAVWMAEQ